MKRSSEMQKRIFIAFALLATGMLVLTGAIWMWQTRVHFAQYQSELGASGHAGHATSDLAADSLFAAHFMEALWMTFAWVSVFAIVIVVVSAYGLSRTLTKPLHRMRSAALQMASGDLGARTPVAGEDELAALGNAFNELAAKLEQQERLRQEMTADIAHELRTPLTILSSHLEAMEDGVWEPSSARFRTCVEEAQRLDRLIEELEQLAYVESPGFGLNKCEVDVVAKTARIMDKLLPSFAQRTIELHFYKGIHTLTINIDEHRYEQVITNLLTNALKFTEPGGHVELTLDATEQGFETIIQDDGIGMTEDEQAHVFERFYRTVSARKLSSRGSGLGLTLVRKLVERQGATIALYSEVGKGTTWTIRWLNAQGNESRSVNV